MLKSETVLNRSLDYIPAHVLPLTAWPDADVSSIWSLFHDHYKLTEPLLFRNHDRSVVINTFCVEHFAPHCKHTS